MIAMKLHGGKQGRRGFRLAMLAAIVGLCPMPASSAIERVDVALVLAVDVSDSIDADRYALQMDGIAKAFEDPEVQASLRGGRSRAMYVALVEWSNRPVVSIRWTLLTNNENMSAFAAEVRATPRASQQFTCMAAALRAIADKLLPQLPVPADRTIIDVSGDGHDNCNPGQPVDAVRDELAAAKVSINGLPILAGDEADTLEAWYREHVIGGPDAFIMPAYAFEDIARTMRRKFVTEISATSIGLVPPR
jgi:hypothetical protein